MNRAAMALLIGLAFIAGLTTATLAQGTVTGTYWYSGAELISSQRAVRVGYAAGAHDMLAALLELIHSEDAATTIVAADACIDRRTSGTLGQFTDWAETLWRGRPEPAARLLLLEACR